MEREAGGRGALALHGSERRATYRKLNWLVAAHLLVGM